MAKKNINPNPTKINDTPSIKNYELFKLKKKTSLKSSLRTIKKVLRYGKPFKVYLILALLGIFISTFFELSAPIYSGRAIKSIIGFYNVDFSAMAENLIIFSACIAVNAIFTWISNWATNIYCFKANKHIRKLFFEKINNVPLKFIDSNSHGDLLSRMINDVELLTDGILEGMSSVTNGIVTIVGTLIFMFSLNVPLALIITIITPISLVISLVIAKKSYKLFAKQAKGEGELNGYLEEYISGVNLVKAFNHEQESIKEFEKINNDFYDVSEKSEFLSNLANPLTRLNNAFVYIIVGLVGALEAISGKIDIGLISTFLSYANSFGKPFNELSSELTELQTAFASAERIFYVLDYKDEPSDYNNNVLASVDGWVNVNNLCFSYSPKQKLIENFNLEVAPGSTVAIVGPTGCGKTTFINLLMRFYDAVSGEILLDGNNIYTLKRSSLREKYGMVLQESWLFNGTIRDNIIYGKPNATEEEILTACQLSGVSDFLEKMPNGLNTLINEDGGNLSQGQKQLICIARVMLIKPPMLILDEATSNIDTRTELKIQQAFSTLMQGRTTFIVAHRLSTIKNANTILVMNKGNVIEQGTHEQLLDKHGFYYHLYNSQFAVDK